jgi:N-acetylglucosamine kinase-like BadF-type ATPase
VKPSAIATLAAAELALMAESVVTRLHLPEGPIILAGGIFKAAPALAAALAAELARRTPRAAVRVLEVEPAYGAVLLALALVEGRLTMPAYAD